MRNTAVTTTRNLKREVKSTGKEAQRMGTQFGKAVKATRTSVGGLMGSLISLKTIIIATFAYRALQRFSRFVASLTELYKKQEKSTLELSQALAGWGNYSKEQIILLKEQASAMQSLVNVDNEEIESMMGLLGTYGMTGKQISEVIGLTIDFAKAKRLELKAAVDLVGKAFVGYTGTLSRYGIILKRGLNIEEKYAATLKALASFTGTAEALTESYGGKVEVLGKAYDDMKKFLGEVIANSIRYSGILEMLTGQVEASSVAIQAYMPVLSALGAKFLGELTVKLKNFMDEINSSEILAWGTSVVSVVKIIGNTFGILFRIVSSGFAHIGILAGEVGATITEIFIRLTEGKKAAEAFRAAWDKSGTPFEKHLEAANKMWDGITTDMGQMLDAGQAMETVWKGVAEGSLLDKLKNKYKDLIVAIKDEMKANADSIRNRLQGNQVTNETIKLTQNMARQFAMASRVEQEQTKYLLSKLSSMSAEDIGTMSEMERKLISKQSVLKETYGQLFGEYAQRQLGIEAEFLKESKVSVEIDLTEDAKQFIKVNKINRERETHRNVERLAG